MELDIEDFDALRNYLASRNNPMPSGAPKLKKLLGGVSNRTVRVDWPDGRGWVLKQALAKLRVILDWFSSPERIAVEAKALRWLNRLAPSGTTPSFVFEDLANHILAMEAIPEGHDNWKAMLLSGQIVPDHFEQFGLLLGTIHRESTRAAAAVREEFADTTHFRTLRLEPYYLYTAETTPEAAGFMTALTDDTLRHKHSLVHGDFSPKNTLVYRDRLILLDYEVVHFGDPAFDLGFAMTHFLSKAHHLSSERARLATGAFQFWQAYRNQIKSLSWADDLEPRAVRHVLGCLLARVAGKSPLEYLTAQDVARQRNVVLMLMENTPTTVENLIAEFTAQIEAHAEN
jgi:5-methylthioribose kinase